MAWGTSSPSAVPWRPLGRRRWSPGDPAVLRRADKLFPPRGGAFADAAEKLRRTGLDRVIREEAAQGKPILGICLGMQLLFEESREFGTWQGLGRSPAKVVPMEGIVPQAYKIPHIGWNGLHFPAGPAASPAGPGWRRGTVCILSTPFMRLNVTTWSSPRRNTGAQLAAAVAPGQCHGLSVSPGEERHGWADDPENLL